MNQSVAIKKSLEPSVSVQNDNNIVSLSKVRMYRRAIQMYRINMIRQKLCGLAIIFVCAMVRIMTGDLSMLCLFGWIGIYMLLSKDYKKYHYKGSKNNVSR